MRKKNVFYIASICFIIFISLTSISRATKIVAVVNSSVVTDTDVEDFESVLCRLDKHLKCGSKESYQMAAMALIESVLKLEHFRQVDLLNDKQFNRGFNEYKRDVLNKINLSSAKSSKIFEDYLHGEYLWSIVVSSQAQTIEISNEEIESFAEKNNLKDKPKNQIKQLILQKNINNVSQNMLEELKKFYLVDYKNL